jgi:formyltetrahydrofolate deformylase
MQWRLTPAARVKRMAIFVSKQDHCLQELLWLWKKGELAAHIPLVVSNHPDAREVVAPFGVPLHHIPVTPDTKAQAEASALELMRTHQVDLIVLARYMQILSPDFIAGFGRPIINIHHSFLPAFVGANPYAQAHARGVKLIGATAHYVTPELDAGPIIDQDVHRVGHRDAVAGGAQRARTRGGLAPGGPGVAAREQDRRLRVKRGLASSGEAQWTMATSGGPMMRCTVIRTLSRSTGLEM